MLGRLQCTTLVLAKLHVPRRHIGIELLGVLGIGFVISLGTGLRLFGCLADVFLIQSFESGDRKLGLDFTHQHVVNFIAAQHLGHCAAWRFGIRGCGWVIHLRIGSGLRHEFLYEIFFSL